MFRLAIDCRMIGSGGIGSFILGLIPYFLENAECLLIGRHEQCMEFLRLPNVEFCFCDTECFSFKEMFNFNRETLAKINSYDAFFSPYCNIPGKIKIPVFSTIHDVVFLDAKELTGTAGRLGRKLIYKRAVNKSKCIFTVSNFSKERIIKNLHPKKNIHVVYNSIPPYLTKSGEDEIPLTQTFPALKNKNYFIFVGNIKKHKGLKVLLEAFNKAKNSGLASILVIAGNKDNFRTGDEQTVSLIEKMQDEDKKNNEVSIIFSGKVSNSTLRQLYKNALALVQPSLYEGFGMPPLESLYLGTPAIISDIPVFKEIYDGFPVTFFKAGDKDELSEKLLQAEKNICKIDTDKLPQKYSYKKSAEVILEKIEACSKIR